MERERERCITCAPNLVLHSPDASDHGPLYAYIDTDIDMDIDIDIGIDIDI